MPVFPQQLAATRDDFEQRVDRRSRAEQRIVAQHRPPVVVEDDNPLDPQKLPGPAACPPCSIVGNVTTRARRSVVLASAVCAAALGAVWATVGVASSATDPQVTGVTARLLPAAVVPHPTAVPRAAAGGFSARPVAGAPGTWFLTYRALGSRPIAAHVHLGRPGTRGPIALTLCTGAGCRSPLSGASAKIARGSGLWKAMLAGRAYVEVETRRNPLGEIRGQTLAVQTAVSPA